MKHPQRLAEIEYLFDSYFNCHLAPVMRSVQDDLSRKQADEMRRYDRSVAGILSGLASANMPGGDPYQTLRVTGEWNSKTTEDYVQMCREKILADKTLQTDLALMAKEWRTAVINEIGRERYDTLSKQLGCDLAYAYAAHRVEQQMIDKLVRDRMPKSSAEYIIRKAAQSSLFGLTNELAKSPLTAEIEARGEKLYKPTKIEKGAGMVIGSGVDALVLGGAGSWSSLAKFVGIDLAFSAVTSSMGNNNPKQATVEDCISKGVFGSQTNVFTGLRKQAKQLKPDDNAFILSTNAALKKKIPTKIFDFMEWTKQWQKPAATPTPSPFDWKPTASGKRDEKYKDVPLIVAPGHEEEYLKEKAKQDAAMAAKANRDSNITHAVETKVAVDAAHERQEEREEQAQKTNDNGWDGLLSNFGLNGIGDIGKNLGYVLAMLPDIVVGLFTGKTQSLNTGNSLMPLASIAAGMFVKNPLLKMMLIGLGGANLVNKAGHEMLERKQGEGLSNVRQTQYKQYADEPLNPRIGSPILQGSTLVASIDNVPCSIQLSETAVRAAQSGALPLNTLANAVLARYDSQQQAAQMAGRNFEESERQTIVRTRGIQ